MEVVPDPLFVMRMLNSSKRSSAQLCHTLMVNPSIVPQLECASIRCSKSLCLSRRYLAQDGDRFYEAMTEDERRMYIGLTDLKMISSGVSKPVESQH